MSITAVLLGYWVESEGDTVTRTLEPGDTAVGGRVREIVLDPATGDLSNRTEVLLYAADKAEHVDTVVEPALERGANVNTARYVASTLAYHGAGRQVDGSEPAATARWATRDLSAPLQVLLDLPPAAGLGRSTDRQRA